ncbi:MAG: RusA family crossover junction endodeoxyribonuclease [Hyphomicrobium sp.]|uniref:RusA family crossover junction endodeoxyribonuclease n=1 Tax=Hyphomicrobium sp. TaxID=82 RepID=UPI0035697622
MIAFTVPGIPVAKGRPRFVRATGRTFTPARTANYEGVVAVKAAEAMGRRAPFEGPLRVTIRATFLVPQSWPAKKRAAAVWKTSKPDADNLAKMIDALNAIVWRDDAQVCELTVQKKFGPIAGLTITVERLDAGEIAK